LSTFHSKDNAEVSFGQGAKEINCIEVIPVKTALR
jgi:hypothetical protein